MWVWTLDDRLLNLALVESIEVIEVYPDGVDPAQLEVGAAEPDLFELVAVTAGAEYVLYDSEEAEPVYQALHSLAMLVTSARPASTGQPLRVADLIDTSNDRVEN